MAFVLAHLSDAHIGPLPRPQWHELIGKRATGYANWLNGRAAVHDMDVLAALVDDMKAQTPDHIAMTGDIVNLGLPLEYPAASHWLSGLGDPAQVSFVPGNHDAYVRGTCTLMSRTFEPWMRSDVPTLDSHIAFPFVRRRGEVVLIGLSSAIPTAPFLASGALGRDQLARFARVLQQSRAEGLARVVLIHHPPHANGAKAGRGLRDARKFEAIIAAEGAELVLHGHNHRMSCSHIAGAFGSVPVVGVASASSRNARHGKGASYRLFRIEATGDNWHIDMQIRSVGANCLVEQDGDWRSLSIAAPSPAG